MPGAELLVKNKTLQVCIAGQGAQVRGKMLKLGGKVLKLFLGLSTLKNDDFIGVLGCFWQGAQDAQVRGGCSAEEVKVECAQIGRWFFWGWVFRREFQVLAPCH